MWVGLIQSTEDLNGAKRLSEKELLLPDCFELGLQSFPAFGLKLKQWLFLDLKLASFQTATEMTGSPGSQAFRLRLELHY